MNHIVDDILRRRGDTPKQEKTEGYTAFRDSGKNPQMSFLLYGSNDRTDGFFFHSIDNVEHRIIKGVEFLSFTHRGKAVTLEGVRLHPLLRALMGVTLTEVHELGNKAPPDDPKATVVTRAMVSQVSLAQEMEAHQMEQIREELQHRP